MTIAGDSGHQEPSRPRWGAPARVHEVARQGEYIGEMYGSQK